MSDMNEFGAWMSATASGDPRAEQVSSGGHVAIDRLMTEDARLRANYDTPMVNDPRGSYAPPRGNVKAQPARIVLGVSNAPARPVPVRPSAAAMPRGLPAALVKAQVKGLEKIYGVVAELIAKHNTLADEIATLRAAVGSALGAAQHADQNSRVLASNTAAALEEVNANLLRQAEAIAENTRDLGATFTPQRAVGPRGRTKNAPVRYVTPSHGAPAAKPFGPGSQYDTPQTEDADFTE